MSKAQWITDNLKPGELYAGIILGKAGAPDYHLVLLPGGGDKRMPWEKAVAAAKELGGELPNRQEQALLYTNLKDQFEAAWYWSGETHESDSSYAWYTHFNGGYQYYYHKTYEGRARAVRRLEI